MKAIINRGKTFGTLGDTVEKNTTILQEVFKKLKEGKAKLLIDNENTLMYEITK